MIPEMLNKIGKWKFHPIDLMFWLIVMIIITGSVLWNEVHADDFKATGPCDNCYQYLDGGSKKWLGQVQVFLNNDGSPGAAYITEQAIGRSIEIIQTYIDIDFVYMGESEAPLLSHFDASRQNTVIVGFAPIGSAGLGWIWWDWNDHKGINSGEITLNSNLYNLQGCVNGYILHEMLHILYVGHTDNQNSIMANSPYNTCSYQATLRLDDIKAIQSLYPAKPNRQGYVTSLSSTQVCRYEPEIMISGSSYSYESCTHTDDISGVVEN